MQDIRTITVDLDDTLWAIDPVIVRAEKALYAWLQEKYPRVTDRFSPEKLQHMRENIATEYRDKSHDFTFLRRKVLGEVSATAGYGDAPVDGAMALFSAYRNDVEIFPDVRPALKALGEKYCVIAVTNGNANLDAIGIRDLFDDVVSASMAGAAKPAREIFDIAVRTGGAQSHETLHVGDHPEADVVGASNAGLRSVWVNRHGNDWPDHLQRPDSIVKEVGELLLLLGFQS